MGGIGGVRIVSRTAIYTQARARTWSTLKTYNTK